MSHSKTSLKTEEGSRYITRLCKHWSHKLELTYDENSVDIRFGEGKSARLDATPTELRIKISADESELATLEDVVARHLKRFAHKETLTFSWEPATDRAS